MGGPVKIFGIEPRRLGEPIEGKVLGQRVCSFVAEHLDGLRLAQIPVEMDKRSTT